MTRAIFVLCAATIFLMSLMMVEAATVNITIAPNSTAHRATVNGQFNGVHINVSTSDMANVTACYLNFTSVVLGEAFGVNLTNGEGGASAGPKAPTILNRTFLNLSIGQQTLNLSGRRDGNYTITGTCWNHSAAVANSTAGGVGSWNESVTEAYFILDSRVPTAPSGLSPTTSDTETAVGPFSAAVTANGTTNCTLWLRETGSLIKDYAYYMPVSTQNGTSCGLGILSTLSKANTYSYVVEASDGTNKTNSSRTTLTLSSTSGNSAVSAGAAAAAAARAAETTSGGVPAGASSGSSNGWVVLVIIAVVIYALSKRKRR